jgi:hypothetical protein
MLPTTVAREVRKREKRGSQGRVPKRRKTADSMAKLAKKVANQAISRNIETKKSVHTSSDGSQIGHNNFILMDSNVLETTRGTADPMTTSTNNIIGDEIMLRGVSIKFMVELNERYSDVKFRLFVVKKAKGDTLSSATFFNGVSGNKMLDTINTERFSVLLSKTFKLTARSQGTTGGETGGISSGFNAAHSDAHTTLSRATKILKFYIPGSKLRSQGKIMYENGSAQPKFFYYQPILYAYSNYSTSDALSFNVARLNDYVRTLYIRMHKCIREN